MKGDFITPGVVLSLTQGILPKQFIRDELSKSGVCRDTGLRDGLRRVCGRNLIVRD